MPEENITARERGQRGAVRQSEVRPERLQRPTEDTSAGMFWYDDSKRPPGMSYEWKRLSTWGEPDKQHQIMLGRYHWKPVPASRHPETAGPNAGDGALIIGGQMLMERPSYLTDEARAEDLKNSRRAVRDKIVSLGLAPEGTMQRDAPQIKKDRNLSVPEDVDTGE